MSSANVKVKYQGHFFKKWPYALVSHKRILLRHYVEKKLEVSVCKNILR